MIKHLHIKNYAIIEELEVNFQDSFVVFTGETGAGKSIIIGALSSLVGERADTSVVKKGKDKALIEGVFSLSKKMKEKLEDADIDFEDELIVRRTIGADGKSNIRVNDHTVTLGFLNELLQGEIDIHSQKENQYLLKKKNHLRLLDRYANVEKMTKEYNERFQLYKDKKEEFEALLQKEYDERDLEYYRFELDELEKANLDAEEEKNLEQFEKRFKDIEKNLNSLRQATALYEEEEGIKEKFYALLRLLDGNESFEKSYQVINDIYYNLEDEMTSIANSMDDFDVSYEEINRVQERLYLIHRLKRKYQMDVPELIAHTRDLQEKIALFENKDQFIAEQSKLLNSLKVDADQLASELSLKRKKAAKDLEKRIVKELKDLMLPNASFEIRIDEKDLSYDGKDDVEFMISLNKGEDVKPLMKVASGGELSRVMLGLKTIFTALSDISLVVFDEIDSGVSGSVAFAIGKKMKTIGKNAQVLTITHLAPVAAFGDQHLYIYKKDSDTATNTMIKELSLKERVDELALIASSVINDKTREAVEDLLNSAKESDDESR